jgi:hypothetical protein
MNTKHFLRGYTVHNNVGHSIESSITPLEIPYPFTVMPLTMYDIPMSPALPSYSSFLFNLCVAGELWGGNSSGGCIYQRDEEEEEEGDDRLFDIGLEKQNRKESEDQGKEQDKDQELKADYTYIWSLFSTSTPDWNSFVPFFLFFLQCPDPAFRTIPFRVFQRLTFLLTSSASPITAGVAAIISSSALKHPKKSHKIMLLKEETAEVGGISQPTCPVGTTRASPNSKVGNFSSNVSPGFDNFFFSAGDKVFGSPSLDCHSSLHSSLAQAGNIRSTSVYTTMSFLYQHFFPSVIMTLFRACCYYILHVFDNNQLVLSYSYNYLMNNITFLGIYIFLFLFF